MAQSSSSEPPVLDRWIDEEVVVPVNEPVFDPDTGKTTIKTVEKAFPMRSYYTNPTPQRVICSSHIYKPHDLKRYIFKCTKCMYHFKGHHPTHKYDPETGYLTHRRTGERF